MTKKIPQDPWQAAFECVGDGLWDWNAIDGSIFYSREWKEMLGYSDSDISSSVDEWHDRIHPADVDECMFNLQAHFRGETPLYSSEHRLRCKDGSFKWILDRGRVIEWQENGRPARMIGTQTDISEQKKRIHDKESAERQLRATFEAAVEISLISINCEGIITLFNSGAERLYGYAAHELIGKFTPLIFHDPVEIAEREAEIFARTGIAVSGIQTFVSTAIQKGHETHEWTCIRKDGTRFPISLTTSPIRDSNGSLTGYLGVAVDLSKQKLLAAKLEKEKQLLHAIIEPMSAGIWDWDMCNHTMYYNPRFKEMLGYTDDELPNIPETWQKLIHPEDLKLASENMAKHTATHGAHPYSQIVRYSHKNGSTVFVFCSGRVTDWTEDAQPARMVGGHIDVTNEYRTYEELSTLKRLFEQTNKVARVGGWEVDLVNATLRWTEVTREIHETPADYTPTVATAIKFYEEGWSRETLQKALQRAIEEEVPFNLELPLITAKGNRIWVRAVGEPVFLAGKCIRLFGAFQDISERKATEIALNAAKNAAESANSAKSKFLAAMSHEIRTPLNGVLGSTELLRNTPLNAEQHDLLEMILNSGDLLLSTVNDILDYSKIEIDLIELDETDFSLLPQINAILDTVTPTARKKGINVIFAPDLQTPAQIYADANRLRQVLLNLIGNAVKFTNKGIVEVGVRPVAENKIEFWVRDTGIGISTEKLPIVFESFTQADASITRQYGGTGLGLAISKKLVELMGGKLSAKSALGVGSEFQFTLPVQQNSFTTPSISIGDLITRDFQGTNILVATVNPISRNFIQAIFEAAGAHVTATDSPPSSIGTSLINDQFHLIIADAELLECASFTDSKIWPNEGVSIMLIATPLSFETKNHHAITIHRPIKIHTILAAARKTIGKDNSYSQESTDRHLETTSKSERVLIVEDNLINQKILNLLLKKLGFTHIALAENGEEALQHLRENPCDVIFMDCQMPVMSGLEATRIIRKDEQASLSKKPYLIIGLSAGAMIGDKSAAMDAGMDDYLTKPVRLDALQSCINQLHDSKGTTN